MGLQKPFWFRSAAFISTCSLAACLTGMYGFMSHVGQAGKHPGRGQDYVSFDISPSGKELVFSGQGKKSSCLFTFALQNAKVSALTAGPAFDMAPSFSPDGRQIVFAASETLQDPTSKPVQDAAHIFLCPTGGGARRQITHSDRYDMSPSFSRDGKRIVFARAARKRPYSMGGWIWDHWDVFTMAADGSGLTRVTNGQYYSLDAPVFSPDGKTILFATTRGEQVKTDIFVTDSAGASEPTMLTHDGHSSGPSYSPTGDRIVFIADTAKNFDYELWLMKPDGTQSRQLTHTGFYNQKPRFTRDGQHLLFLSDPDRRSRCNLMQIDAGGANLRRIADSSLFDAPLKWKP